MVALLALLSAAVLFAAVHQLAAAGARPAVDADAYRVGRSAKALEKAALHYVRQRKDAGFSGAAAYPAAVTDIAGDWISQPAFMTPTPRLPSGLSVEFVYVPEVAGPPVVPERFYLCITGTVATAARLDSLLAGAASAGATPAGDIGCTDAANGLAGPVPAQFPTRYTIVRRLV